MMLDPRLLRTGTAYTDPPIIERDMPWTRMPIPAISRRAKAPYARDIATDATTPRRTPLRRRTPHTRALDDALTTPRVLSGGSFLVRGHTPVNRVLINKYNLIFTCAPVVIRGSAIVIRAPKRSETPSLSPASEPSGRPASGLPTSSRAQKKGPCIWTGQNSRQRLRFR